MAVLKKLFSRGRNFKKLKRAAQAGRMAVILEKNHVDLFIDVGANTGQTAQELREQGYSGKIISFEPIRECHDELVAKSASDPLWSIAPRCALGEEEGSVEFLISEGSSLSSIDPPTEAMREAFPKVRTEYSETVAVHRLDNFMKDKLEGCERVLLKIDTQGHDMKVLRGAEGIMGKLAGIKVEMSLFPLYEGETLYLEFLNFLHERGFHPHLLFDVGFSKKLGRQLQIDGIFMRDL